MGVLARFLQQQFAASCPAGWECSREVPLLTADLEKTLGYAPRADILLQRADASVRLWIEFEVSRADPVANHAKFATAHLFRPQERTDSFIAMVSSHVNRGRRNLASNTIAVMRLIGMSAFQTTLLPKLPPETVKRLNHSTLSEITLDRRSIEAEVGRVMQVASCHAIIGSHRIHFASDLSDVIINLRTWNSEIETADGQALWGRRTVKYFVFDPETRLFAPSKFCAYLAIPDRAASESRVRPATARTGMRVPLYVALDESEPRFDGSIAHRFLRRDLAMQLQKPTDVPAVLAAFQEWSDARSEAIRVHPARPFFLCPPKWFQ